MLLTAKVAINATSVVQNGCRFGTNSQLQRRFGKKRAETIQSLIDLACPLPVLALLKTTSKLRPVATQCNEACAVTTTE